MNKAESACRELDAMEALAAKSSPIHSLSALAKLTVTIVYILMTVSFPKYDLTGLFPMVLYPVVGYTLSFIPMRTCFYKLRIVLPLVCAVGLLNPFFDRQVLTYVGSIPVTGGVVSMVTLMLKGIFSLMASFLLIATTSIEDLCAGLRRVHFPRLLTSLLLLTFRYVNLFLEEISVMWEAYALRSPGQKGIAVSAWGSFLGQLLLRTMDRANALYESMELRGFHGEFFYREAAPMNGGSWLYLVIWCAVFAFVRSVNLPALLGGILV